jgi:hypothetical protein
MDPVPLINGKPPSAAGFQLITQMAQTAIATYSLKIKSGYLSDLETNSGGY